MVTKYNNREKMDVRKAELVDIDQIVKVHQQCFGDYFLTMLGRGMLTRYYRNYLEHHDTVNVVVEVDNKVCAFICGVYKPSDVLKTFYRKNFFYVLGVIFLRLLTLNIGVWQGVMKRVSHMKIAVKDKLGGARSSSVSGNSVSEIDALTGRLVSIACSPAFQGKNIAGEMITFFENQLIAHGAKCVKLTVKSENDRAIRFYKKVGWSVLEDRGNELVFMKNL